MTAPTTRPQWSLTRRGDLLRLTFPVLTVGGQPDLSGDVLEVDLDDESAQRLAAGLRELRPQKPPPPDPGIWHCCGRGHIEGHDSKCPATTWRGYGPLLIFAACMVVVAVLGICGALAS